MQIIPAELGQEIPKVTEQDLRAILTMYGRNNPFMDAHLLSVITIGRIMGKRWFSNWACEVSSENKPGMYFYPSNDPEDKQVIWRQIRFAELLFNFQNLRGFSRRTNEWQGNQPEAIVAELESAFYMRSCNHMPTFVATKTSGQRTPDFDVVLSFGLKCAWEAKSRLEHLSFNERRLKESLDEARKQLPAGTSNIIFVRIPEAWTLKAEFQGQLESVVSHLFRNSKRAISVLFHWELWATPSANEMRYGISGIEFPNLRWDIITGQRRVMAGYSGFPPGWVHFDRI
jgi:hypothetical protein